MPFEHNGNGNSELSGYWIWMHTIMLTVKISRMLFFHCFSPISHDIGETIVCIGIRIFESTNPDRSNLATTL